MIILLGASASGKTEIAKALSRLYGIKKATTHTSRLPRVGERDGVDYHFVSNEEFERLLKEDAFVEHTFYNNHYYGCSKKEISDDKCVVVDPNGLKSFLKLNDPSIVTFFLVAEEKTRENRMSSRGDKKEDIKRRIEGDRIDFDPDRVGHTDFLIHTDTKTIEELTSMVYKLYKDTLKERGY